MAGSHAPLAATARALAEARLRASARAAFPGAVPQTLDDAYAVQRAAVDLWPDEIAGWKVGRMSPDLADRFGTNRFVGPIFRASVSRAPQGAAAPFAVFTGGSAALEAEFVVFVGERGPQRLMTGVEVAASPLASLPDLGSLATIADFGNNAGLILGAEVPLELLARPSQLGCETQVADAAPVRRTGEALPGGPAGAFAFAEAETQRIGLPLQPGQFVSTGAVTGIHPVERGQSCSADFGAFGRIDCQVVARSPLPLPSAWGEDS